MMNRRTHITLFLLLMSLLFCGKTMLYAQNPVQLGSVQMLLQQGNPDSALKAVNTYLKVPGKENDPTALLFKGMAYKELFKKNNANVYYLDSAVSAYDRGLKYAADSVVQKNIRQSLRFVGKLYYDVIKDNMDTLHYMRSIEIYSKYKKALIIADPKYDFHLRDIEFYLALGTVYTDLYNNNRQKNIEYFQKAVDAYMKVLEIDPRNYTANFCLAVLYHTYGVEIYNSAPIDINIEDLEKIQDSANKVFRKGLPYAEVANELQPKRVETLKILRDIYYSLNDFEKSKFFQDLINKLESEKADR
jgi:tetratricopeptide (TPR) repeat protein